MIAHLSKSETIFDKFNLKKGLLTKRCDIFIMMQYLKPMEIMYQIDGRLHEKMSFPTSIGIYIRDSSLRQNFKALFIIIQFLEFEELL